MIRAVLLDVGGPILNEDAEYQRWTNFLIAALHGEGIEIQKEKFSAILEEEISRCEQNPWLSTLWRIVRPNLEQFRRICRAFRESQRDFLQELPGVFVRPEARKAIPELAQRYILALAGNQPSSALRILDKAGILSYFQWEEVSESMSVAKPSPLFFRIILDALRVEPEEAVMVGDRLDHDIFPARLLGLKTVRVLVGPYARQEPPSSLHIPDAVIPDLSSLERVLLGFE